jgi:hypothetical protein
VRELTKLAADWPITRLVEVWNAFAGAPPFGDLKPVKKFTDRKTAVTRWQTHSSLGKEMGLAVESFNKRAGRERAYRTAAK